MDFGYLIDKLNIKELPEEITLFLRQNNQKDCCNLRGFYSRLLEEISFDVKESYLNRILKYLSSDTASRINIIDDFRTQESTEEERNSYYPISIYCPICKKDSTRILNYENGRVEYSCDCGYVGDLDIEQATNIKLQWKVDWPMRWMVEGVTFETGGIDHSASNGSKAVSERISREIFGFEPPIFQGYGWLGFAGVSSMHSSSGVNITPAGVLKFYTPEIVRWLFAKYEPEDAYNFYFDDTIIRHYSEFDKGLAAYLDGSADEFTKSLFDLCLIEGRNYQNETSFNTISSLAPIVNFNHESLVKAIKALAGPFPQVKFLPTGGVDLDNLKELFVDLLYG